MSSDSRTKYLILVPDGMADTPSSDGGRKTPLADAGTPWMDKMATAGTIGLARTVPEGMHPGSDVANLSIMGYSPREVYTGRAPFEAASIGVELDPTDLAFRLNLVTLEQNYTVMADHSADHISTSEAHEIVNSLIPVAESYGFTLLPGVSYRNLLIWPNGPKDCTYSRASRFSFRTVCHPASHGALRGRTIAAHHQVLEDPGKPSGKPAQDQTRPGAREFSLALGPGDTACRQDPTGEVRHNRRGRGRCGPGEGHRKICGYGSG